MKLSRLPGKPGQYLPLVLLWLVLMLLMPRTAKFGYDYRKGSPWKHENLIAQFDFPILKTEEQILEEKSKSDGGIVPYYRYAADVANRNIKAAEGLDLGFLKSPVVGEIRLLYERGIVSDAGVKTDKKGDPNAVLFIQKDKRAVQRPVTEVYQESAARAKLVADLGAKYHNVNVDSILRSAGVYDLIVPNLVYDKQMTDLTHAESASYISPTSGFVNRGQLIVSEGEMVTGEIAQMLDSYKVEYEANMGYTGPRILFWLGNALIALALVLIFYLIIYFSNPALFGEPNRYLYLQLIFLVLTVAALSVGKAAPEFLFMVPFTLGANYLHAFFKPKVIVPVYIVSLIPLLIFCEGGPVLFVMFLVAGLCGFYSFQFFNRGWHQFLSAAVVFVTLLVTYFGFRFIDAVSTNPYRDVAFLLLGSLLSVAGYPAIYLFEKIFNLVSNSRLIELTDTSNPTLRELDFRAPGTFQHSLQVMSMAEAAARSIGANVLLVRAGALYHDIGKMTNPACFIENETLIPGGKGYHSSLTPAESATRIIRHVTDGMEIANRIGLPKVISDFIITHHGTSCTGYFWNIFLRDGGDPSQIKTFTYPGRKPHTQEQVLLMLCDSIEAASRTLSDFAPASVDAFVEKMVAGKMNEGQMEEADLSIKDLVTVKNVLKQYLVQVHHERVEYPENKTNK